MYTLSIHSAVMLDADFRSTWSLLGNLKNGTASSCNFPEMQCLFREGEGEECAGEVLPQLSFSPHHWGEKNQFPTHTTPEPLVSKTGLTRRKSPSCLTTSFLRACSSCTRSWPYCGNHQNWFGRAGARMFSVGSSLQSPWFPLLGTPKAAIKEAYGWTRLTLLLHVQLGLKHSCFTNSNTQYGTMVKPPRHTIRNKCNWELCRWLSDNLAVFRIWKLIWGRLAELGFRELLVSDYWDDQKGSPFLHHKQREQQGTLRLDTVASSILLKLKITLFIF